MGLLTRLIIDMVIYISESLNSKKNGGSSLSGYEFLQLLRIKYKDIVVLTYDDLLIDEVNNDDEFYGHKLNRIHRIIIPKKIYTLGKVSVRRILIKIYYFFMYLFRKKTIDLEEFKSQGENVLFVNSWSTIFRNNIKSYEKYHTVCIVRGSPESFIWQSHEKDKEKLLYKEAAYLDQFKSLIYVSKNGIDSWSKYKAKKTNNFYLPNSINEIDLEIEREKYLSGDSPSLYDQDDYNILVVGSIQIRKAQDLLLNLFPKLPKLKRNAKIHLVGNISEMWGGNEIIKKIKESNYSKYFVIHGHSDNVFKYMFQADLLIFTSRAEAFPRTVAEYMGVGKPIIAADVSGVNEMIDNNKNGLLYDPFKKNDLINAVESVLNSHDKGRALGLNAKKTYYNNFSKSEQAKKANTIMEKILELNI